MKSLQHIGCMEERGGKMVLLYSIIHFSFLNYYRLSSAILHEYVHTYSSK